MKRNNDMNAIILAAGKGERLRPLTNKIPKCMVKLFDKTILKYQIDVFRSCKINDITVVTGYEADKIKMEGVNFLHNQNYDTTNMVETLFCAKEKLTENVIISYGDIIFEKQVLQKLINSNWDSSVIIDNQWKKYWQMRFENPLDDVESLRIDENGLITNIGMKVNSLEEIQGQYIGLMKFKNEGVKNLKKIYEKAKLKSVKGVNLLNENIPFEKSYMTDLIQAMINEGVKINAVKITNGWLELDSIDDYNLYQKKNNEGTISELISLKQ
jgi:L-glutamine-phosphate cytidylyltransferase